MAAAICVSSGLSASCEMPMMITLTGRVGSLSDLSCWTRSSSDSELLSSAAPSVKITTELNQAGSQFSWASL